MKPFKLLKTNYRSYDFLIQDIQTKKVFGRNIVYKVFGKSEIIDTLLADSIEEL